MRSEVRQKTVHVGVSLSCPCYRISGTEQQTQATEQFLQITGGHSMLAYPLELCDCQFLHLARAEASYAAKYLSAHKQFSQQNICLKAQKLNLAEQ